MGKVAQPVQPASRSASTNRAETTSSKNRSLVVLRYSRARGRAVEPPASGPLASAGDGVTKLGYGRRRHHLRGDVDGEPRGADGCE
jgi:hypothetical protein